MYHHGARLQPAPVLEESTGEVGVAIISRCLSQIYECGTKDHPEFIILPAASVQRPAPLQLQYYLCGDCLLESKSLD